MQSLGEKIRDLRSALKMTQRDLAEKLEIDIKSIQRYETGKSRPDTYSLVKLATFFDVSSDYLLGLTSLMEQMEERESKLSEHRRIFYKNYIKCKNDYKIYPDEKYYWIEAKDDKIGGQTMWEGFTDDSIPKEIRVLCPVIPEKAIEICTQTYGKPMVLNTEEDACTFLIYGGQAIVREETCEKYLPWFLEPFVVETGSIL